MQSLNVCFPGTKPGTDNVVRSTAVGLTTQAVAAHLRLSNGETYCATVEGWFALFIFVVQQRLTSALNFSRQCGWSEGFGCFSLRQNRP